MKIAAPFAAKAEWRNIPDEYNIDVSTTTQLESLIVFLETFPNKWVNISFEKEINFLFLKKIKQYQNFSIRVHSHQLLQIPDLQENNFNFFFDRDLPCCSFSVLDFMLEQGVSDIYIYDDLCYWMPEVSEKCKKNNVQIRLVLNKIPSLSPISPDNVKAPIFSPRAVDLLEEYIDVFEFDCYIAENAAYDWHYFSACYRAYIEKREWLGDLRELNRNVPFFYPVYSEPWELIKRKLSCGRACSYRNNCNRCNDIIEIAQKLNAEDIYLKKGKKQEEESNKNDI